GRGRRQLKRVEETEGRRLRRVLEIEGHDPAEQTAELAFGELVLGMVGQAGVTDPRDLGMRREMPRDTQCALALATHAQLQGPHPADAEPCLMWWEIGAIEDRSVAH